ncbi:apoptosis regulatory protein Siva isoform X1 [Betta splendens]|uniref:Apoptosis regulatory protein Siva isoform X1 n=1 Tax=Betta splendens TaxID=158456 RepID=A0A6P7LLP6_BETSP|nr:apoptosis regulatory protein Siva isoform X1 [Betta splendens]
MPKRTCPFPETFSSQYKVHIGQQELNNYSVFGNKYRQQIYEKTKNLLFNGAKDVMDKLWGAETCTDLQPVTRAETPPCSQTLLRGQTLIGHDGRLTRANAARDGSVDAELIAVCAHIWFPDAPAAAAGCCVCQKSQGSRTPCSQCDRSACASCVRQCSSCCSFCCSVCTIIDYSGRYDEVLCCSCST